MNILFSGFVDPNHSSFGGYHNIVNIPCNSKTLLTTDYPLGSLGKKYHLRKIPLWIQDLDTRIKRSKFDITHLFYGEITMFPFLPYSKSKTNKSVITLHLDIEKQHLHKFFLKNLSSFDGIIVLSTQQKKYYKEKYGIETTFIPHGFDKPRYTYNLPVSCDGNRLDVKDINLITSGKNYRDFDTLEKVIAYCASKELCGIHFHIVGAPESIKQKLSRYNHVSIYNRISDDEYYTLMQSCDYHFLPLLFATANNALLEAQSLGIKSILPRIEGVSDYAAPEPMNIYYDSIDNLKCLLSSLTKSDPSDDIIDFSKRFYWENIYENLLSYYNNLLDNN